MKITDLSAREIIVSILGERENLKSEAELQKILKSRLTKKERSAMNAHIQNTRTDDARFDELVVNATKKIKNESTHKEFFA